MPNPLEQAAAKAMGMAKEAKAHVSGLHGVFATLAKEHGEVAALLKRVQLSEKVEVREKLFPKIRAELLSHEQAERSEVYPALRQHPRTTEIAAEHETEAIALADAIRTVEDLDVQSDAWMEAFDAMAELVIEHATQEENEYFPVAMEALGNAEAQQLDERFMAAKQALLQNLSRGS